MGGGRRIDVKAETKRKKKFIRDWRKGCVCKSMVNDSATRQGRDQYGFTQISGESLDSQMVTFVDDQRMVDTKSPGIGIKDGGLDKDLLICDGLVAVAFLEDVRGSQALGRKRILGNLEEACAWSGLGLCERKESRKGDEKRRGKLNHLEAA